MLRDKVKELCEWIKIFIATKQLLLGIIALESNVYACYSIKWINNQEKSIIFTHYSRNYIIINIMYYLIILLYKNQYIH